MRCVHGARPLLLTLAVTALGAGWPELPKDVWSIKSSDLKDQPGALVLVDRWHFHRRQLERFRRVLVLAEAGKSMPEMTLYGDQITKLQGRTVFPDLREQPFTQGQDVIKTTMVQTRRDALQATKVIPPGVTAHCVVDVSWVEPINDQEAPVPEGSGLHYAFSLSAPVPVRLAEVVIDADIAGFGWVQQFLARPDQKREELKDAKGIRHLFRDLPARPSAVLATEGELAYPICQWYWSPMVRDWLTHIGFRYDRYVTMLDAAAITILYRWLMEHPNDRPGRWSSLWNLGKGLDVQDPHAKAVALLRRLREKVKTIEETGERPRTKELDRQSMETALKRGWGTYNQLWRLAFHLLRENGLNTSVVLALDREENVRGDVNNPWQYDQVLLAVDDGKRNLLYLNPGSTFHPIGLPPWLQGSDSMLVVPGKDRLDWTARIQTLPVEDAAVNTEKWRIAVKPGEESDEYAAGVETSGSRAARWKSRIKGQASSDFKQTLGPLVEKGGFKLTQATGKGVDDPWTPLSLSLSGNRESEGGRRRSVLPFPFLTLPFEVPASWPDRRDVSIQFPMTSLLDAEARIPWKGAAPAPSDLPPLEKANPLGKASWKAVMEEGPTGTELVVRLRLEVATPTASAYQYARLKELTDWFQDALSRTVPAPAVN